MAHGTGRGLGSLAVLRFASDALADLVEGTGWTMNTTRRLGPARLGIAGKVRYLDFRGIAQPGLRDLVKRWSRQRLTAKGVAMNGVAKDLLAIRHLSASLAIRRPGKDLANLDREFLEEWLVDVSTLRSSRTDEPSAIHTARRC